MEFFAGWIAGGAGVVIGHPFDTIKTRIQTNNGRLRISDCFRTTVKNESVLALYKGMLAPLISTGFMNSLMFAGYGFTLRMLHPHDIDITNRKNLPMKEVVGASIVGTMFQLIPAIPVELIKTRLQMQHENAAHFWQKGKGTPRYNGPFDLIRKVVRTEGIRGLYKGGGVMFWRDNIGFLFYIPSYELVTRTLHDMGYNETFIQIMAGGTAGCLGWVSICPFEVVKNRVQSSQKPLGAVDCAKDLLAREGAGAFFRGSLLLGLRGFPVNAVVFVVYENMLRLLGSL